MVDDFFAKLEKMPDGPRKELGILIIRSMVDYFLTCRDVTDQARGLRTMELEEAISATNLDLAGLRAQAEYLEKLIPVLFGIFEEMSS
jgi:hypothetical protein